jgi:hypothetical protein
MNMLCPPSKFSEHRYPNAHVNPGRDCGAAKAAEGRSDWELRGPIRISALLTLNEGDIHNCGCPTNRLWPARQHQQSM